MDRGSWRATVHGVTKSRTRLSDGIIPCMCMCVCLLHGTAYRILVPQPGIKPTPAAVEEQCVHHLTTMGVPIIQDVHCPATCLFPLMAMGFLRPMTSLYITGSSIVPGTQPEGNAFC